MVHISIVPFFHHRVLKVIYNVFIIHSTFKHSIAQLSDNNEQTEAGFLSPNYLLMLFIPRK